MAAKYTDAQREQALQLIEDGMTVTEASNVMEIPRSTISGWRGKVTVTRDGEQPSRTSDASRSPSSDEIAELKNEIAQLKEQLASLNSFLDSKEAIFLWAARKMRADDKARDDLGSDSAAHPIFAKK